MPPDEDKPGDETSGKEYSGPPYTDDDEGLVRSDFLAKAKATIGKVPFIEEAVAAYYAAIDPNTPARVKTILLAALAYFIVPTDMVPDFIVGLGFTDDAAVLFGVLRALSAHITEAHRTAARRFLGSHDEDGPREQGPKKT